MLAYATRHFAFANVGQLTAGISESIGAAKAAGLSFEDLVATLSAFNKVGLQGGEAGAAVIETIHSNQKRRADQERGTRRPLSTKAEIHRRMGIDEREPEEVDMGRRRTR